MQVMDIDGYRVLFSAESDAVDESGFPVEIKTSNPRYWGTKVMFQMLSNGSVSLYTGTKKPRHMLSDVNVLPFQRVTEMALGFDEVGTLEKNIVSGMEILLAAVESGQISEKNPFEINFDRAGNMELCAYDREPNVILPPKKVIQELLEL